MVRQERCGGFLVLQSGVSSFILIFQVVHHGIKLAKHSQEWEAEQKRLVNPLTHLKWYCQNFQPLEYLKIIEYYWEIILTVLQTFWQYKLPSSYSSNHLYDLRICSLCCKPNHQTSQFKQFAIQKLGLKQHSQHEQSVLNSTSVCMFAYWKT